MADSMYQIISTLLYEEPFYGHIICQMNRIETEQIPTAGVTIRNGKIYLLYNPKFMDTIVQFEHKRGVLKHELLHIIFKHILRDDLDDHNLANIAMDLVINQLVGKENLPNDLEHYGQFIDDYQRKHGSQLFPEHETTDFYYKSLKKLKDEGKLGEEPNYDHYWTVSSDSDGDGIGKKIGKNAELSDGLKAVIEAESRSMIEKSKAADPESWGNLPGDLRKLLEEMYRRNKPALPWKVILQRFVSQSTQTYNVFTQKKISKRYGVRPGLKKKRKLHLLLALDSSGSVSDQYFAEFFREMDGIVKAGSTITVADVDHAVQDVYNYRKGMKISRTGYGGTSFDPVFQWIQENKMIRNFGAVIYCTDGYAPPPSIHLNLPVLFVITPDGQPVEGYKNLKLPHSN